MKQLRERKLLPFDPAVQAKREEKLRKQRIQNRKISDQKRAEKGLPAIARPDLPISVYVARGPMKPRDPNDTRTSGQKIRDCAERRSERCYREKWLAFNSAKELLTHPPQSGVTELESAEFEAKISEAKTLMTRYDKKLNSKLRLLEAELRMDSAKAGNLAIPTAPEQTEKGRLVEKGGKVNCAENFFCVVNQTDESNNEVDNKLGVD
jgi:hypothetical protein